ncbi:MAG TPA: ABC transporter permease [Ignavibacteria bacterium]|nr:ABC transporter permease [Ignavibacteria bacterium]
MGFERFIAKRYLLSKKKVQFITIITFISIIGVTVGVAALISVLSVFNGFNKYQFDILTGFDPHIRIDPDSGNSMTDFQGVLNKTGNISNIKAIAPFTMNKGIISSKKNSVVAFIKGVDESKIEGLSDIKEKTFLGDFEFKDSDETGGIILGGSLAMRLDVKLRDTISVMSPVGMERALTQIVTPKTMKFVIRGLYDSQNKEYNRYYSYISMPKSQSLFEMGKNVTGVEMRLDDISSSDAVKDDLEKSLGNGYKVSTWYNLHEELYSVMKLERKSAFIILSLIIAVATLSIVGSLTMTVIEKRRDIGILKAMGTQNSSIVKIFMFEGVLIGIYGTVFGCLLGFAVCMAQIKLKMFPLDSNIYSIDALPIDLRYADFIYVSLCAMFLAVTASLYPALRAAKEEPIDAIRWE